MLQVMFQSRHICNDLLHRPFAVLLPKKTIIVRSSFDLRVNLTITTMEILKYVYHAFYGKLTRQLECYLAMLYRDEKVQVGSKALNKARRSRRHCGRLGQSENRITEYYNQSASSK